MAVIPPVAFSQIGKGLYRCSHPSKSAYPFLISLRLKTVLCVDGCEIKTEFKEFCDINEIQLISRDVGHNQEPFVMMNEEIISEIIEITLGRKHFFLFFFLSSDFQFFRSKVSTVYDLLCKWKGNK